jgi:hypothetical protein
MVHICIVLRSYTWLKCFPLDSSEVVTFQNGNCERHAFQNSSEEAEEAFPEGEFYPHEDMTKVLLQLLQHHNARPHTSLHIREVITEFQWTFLPHPPYSSDLAPSDYRPFRPLKDEIHGKRFEDNEDTIPKNRAGCDRMVPRRHTGSHISVA